MQEAMGSSEVSPVSQQSGQEGLIKQTILLVEDEEMVRGLMCEVLEREGYTVLVCSHPKQGIEVCQQHCGHIDLLLTDVVMPGMNGRDMANRMREIMPELRVVFMSGYTEHVLVTEGQVDPQFEYLQKPFTLKTLTRKLAHVLRDQKETRVQ